MKQLYLNHIAIIVFSFSIFSSATGQEDKALLERKKEKLEQEIQWATRVLNETTQNREASLHELVVLDSKISNTEKLIQTISDEIDALQTQINNASNEIDVLEEELEAMKQEYAQMVNFAFKNRNSYSRLMFIFSSRTFNQAYQRLKYLQQYSEYRKQQAEQIKEKQKELELVKEQITFRKNQKQQLLNDRQSERTKLTSSKERKTQSVQELQDREKELNKSIRDKQKAADRFQKAIETIIAEEIRLAAEANKTSDMPAENVFALTPAELELSESFTSNKGKLPWPLERGILSSSFGEHSHPELKGIKIKNNGINIITSSGEEAHAIFNGEVTRVISVPRYNNVVIIRHGEYLSVYSNLDDVKVAKGDKVVTRQHIGTVFTHKDTAKTELHFELWKGKEMLNPADWIAK